MKRSAEFWLFIALIIFVVCNIAVARGDTLDLGQATQIAESHNADLAQARAQAGEASWKTLEVLSQNIPRVSVTANHFMSLKYQTIDISLNGAPPFNFPEIYPKTQITVGAYWTVFDGLSTPFAYAAAVGMKDAAKLNLERTEFAAARMIRLKFYQALASQTLLDVAQEDVKTLEEHQTNIKDILAGGAATKFDLLRVNVQLEEANSELAAAQDNVVLARRDLFLAMGVENDDRALSGTLPIPEESAVPKDLSLDLANRQDLQGLQRKVDAAENINHASIGGYLPKVTLLAEKQYYVVDNYSVGGRYNNAYDVGFTLSWNLFDGGASIAKQKENSYAYEEAETGLGYATLKAKNDFETWRRKFYYNVGLYGARKRAIESAQESVRLARLGYGAGTRTSTDVLDAELDLFRARAGLVHAQVDGAEALINLELALGRNL